MTEPEFWIGDGLVFWPVVAILAYVLMGMCVVWALRPKPLANPDWFWTGGQWVRSDEGISVGWVESTDVTKPEQSDPQESKPTSGAG